MTTGERIKIAREKINMTQTELGEKIGVTGVAVMRYEKGLRQPKFDQLQAISDALGVTVDFLRGYEKEKIIIPGRLKIIEINDPQLENYLYRIEAKDEEAFAYGTHLVENAGVNIDAFTPAGRIVAALNILNDKGQAIAVERIEELTKIPDYQRTSPQRPQDSPQATQSTEEGTDTAPPQDAPEMPSEPPEGTK